MTTEDTIKTAIPTTSGFRNFALCTLTFAFTTRPPHKTPILPNLPAYKAAYSYVPIRHYICRESSTNHLLFMQNKPNFQDAQMNLSSILTKNYENESVWTLGENKPNSNPIKAGPERIYTELRRSSRMGQFQNPAKPSKKRKEKSLRNFFRVSVDGNDFQGCFLPGIYITLILNRCSGSLHKPLKLSKFELFSRTGKQCQEPWSCAKNIL